MGTRNNQWEIGSSVKMQERMNYAHDFYNRILDPEEHPMFCSDEASLYAIYFGDIEEVKILIKKEYNKDFTDEELSMPFWKLLDLLYKR